MLGLGLLIPLWGAGCRVEIGAPAAVEDASATAEVWVYTSMYQEVLDRMAPRLAAEVPGVAVQWYQAGSEKVAQRWRAEHDAGGSRACLLATSDPGWYRELADAGELLPYVSPRALELPRDQVRPEFAAMRLSMMVLASTADEAPAAFADLVDPRWAGRFSSGDPLASGTTFTAMAAWDARYGPAFVERLSANGWVAAGGGSAVMARMESGERPVGVVLLENLLAKPGPTVVYPADGAVVIPGMLAIPRDCPAPEAAKRVYDWLLGPAAQAEVVAGGMYSPFPGSPTPAGARPLAEVRTFDAGVDLLDHVARNGADLRARYGALKR